MLTHDSTDRLQRGVLLVSAGFFGIFLAFNSSQALATSLTDPSVASTALSILYVTFAVTCTIAPKAVDRLGPRLAMCVGAAPYILLILCQLYPAPVLTYFTHFLVGLGAPLLWTGEAVYIGRCAIKYAVQRGSSVEEATTRFHGLFFSLFQANGSVGLLVSTVILSVASTDNARGLLFVLLSILALLGGCVFLWLPAIGETASMNQLIGTGGEPVLHDEVEDFDQDNTLVISPGLSSASTLATSSNSSLPSAIKFSSNNSTATVPTSVDEVSSPGGLSDGSETPISLKGYDRAGEDSEGEESDNEGGNPNLGSGGINKNGTINNSRGQQEKIKLSAQAKGEVSFMQTLRLAVSDKQMLMMIPLIFYNGVSLAFTFGEYTKSVATQALGPAFSSAAIGLFFLSNAVFTHFIARMRRTPQRRRLIFLTAAAAHLLLYIALMTLTVPSLSSPSSSSSPSTPQDSLDIETDHEQDIDTHSTSTSSPSSTSNGSWLVAMLILFGSLLLSLGDSVYESQPPAILQTIFKHRPSDSDSAMALLKLAQSLGMAMQFFIGSSLTVPQSSFLLSTLLIAASYCLTTIEHTLGT